MIKSPFDTSKTIEERLAIAETIIMRLARRSKTMAKSVLFPYTISKVIKQNVIKGNVLNYMFPCSGTLIGANISIVGVDIVDLVIELRDSKGKISKEYMITPEQLDFEFEYRVEKGCKLSIYANTLNVNLSELWINLLWLPDIGTTRIKNFLLNEIDKDLDAEGLFK